MNCACGNQDAAGAAFCSRCGRPLTPPQVAGPEPRPKSGPTPTRLAVCGALLIASGWIRSLIDGGLEGFPLLLTGIGAVLLVCGLVLMAARH